MTAESSLSVGPDMPVRFFRKDLGGFSLKGKSWFGKVSSKAYEISIPKPVDRPQGGQTALNACLLILRGLTCVGNAQLKFETLIDEVGRDVKLDQIASRDRNLPTSCVPCYLHTGERCSPYHDYDKSSGVEAGQVRYFVLSNQGRSQLSVDSVTFVSALLAKTDDGSNIRYENTPFPVSPPKRVDNVERIGYRIEDTTVGYKAWSPILAGDGGVNLPWEIEVKLSSGDRQLTDIALLYVYNVQSSPSSHGHINCVFAGNSIGEQYVGPKCDSPLIFDFSPVSRQVFGSPFTLRLESQDANVRVSKNIEFFFITV